MPANLREMKTLISDSETNGTKIRCRMPQSNGGEYNAAITSDSETVQDVQRGETLWENDRASDKAMHLQCTDLYSDTTVILDQSATCTRGAQASWW